MPQTARTSFGIFTPQVHVEYGELLRVWQEADAVPGIEHAWLFDHLMPIGDVDGPAHESWTLLSALAAQTARLRLGVLVTSNRFRPPAFLAKIAATVDIVSSGRLDLGIGAGSRPGHPLALREYEAHGLPFHDAAHATGSLDEALTVIRRLWTDPRPFDFDGQFVRLAGALCNPKPLQRPHPPILIGGASTPTLRLVAKHADMWNYQGGDLQDGARRAATLDRLCQEIGRDPAAVTRSIVLPVSYDDPASTRRVAAGAIDAGFSHLVLALPAPYPRGVAAWLSDAVLRGLP